MQLKKIDIVFQIMEVSISNGLKKAIENSKMPTADVPTIMNRAEYSTNDLKTWLSVESVKSKRILSKDEICECTELVERLFFLKETEFYID